MNFLSDFKSVLRAIIGEDILKRVTDFLFNFTVKDSRSKDDM